MKTFYVDVLEATDYWLRFEWQHRGSPHVHGVAWLQNAPDIEKLLSSDDSAELLDAAERITAYVHGLVSTMNPGISADGCGGVDGVYARPAHNASNHSSDGQRSIAATRVQLRGCLT